MRAAEQYKLAVRRSDAASSAKIVLWKAYSSQQCSEMALKHSAFVGSGHAD